MTNNFFSQIVQKPIGQDLMKEILKSNFFTSRLVSEYVYFNKDDNGSLFDNYIKESLGKRNRLFNAIEMANIRRYYSHNLIKEIDKCLIFSKSMLLKLSCLDYLIDNNKLIRDADFTRLNLNALSHTRSTLVIFQARINLFLVNDKYPESSSVLVKFLSNQDDPAFYYRIINTIDNNKIERAKKKLLKSILQSSIKSNTNLVQLQKKELLSMAAGL